MSSRGGRRCDESTAGIQRGTYMSLQAGRCMFIVAGFIDVITLFPTLGTRWKAK